ncbi:MAG: hypothetical protein JST00_39615 [Deltaproteobacteria bacterium]|nr:hypothetical protein [Deltaproteobacteria bacterium]
MTPRARTWMGFAVLAMTSIGVMIAWADTLASRAAAAPHVPLERPRPSEGSPYVSSSACLPCHPGEHASFARTFHRTMTQDATPATVLAPFERRGGEVWAEGRRIVLTTGSHRHQTYWTTGDHPGDLRIVPSVWLVAERRLVPRQEAFVTPPDAPIGRVRWSSSCIACHAVAGEPRHDESRDAFDTRAAELGITCEACHGPGAKHVARHRDPFERYAQRGSKVPDPTIVHPRKITPARSAAVCGQCHSYAFPRDQDEFWTHGYARAFRAGDPLDASRLLLPADGAGVSIETAEESLFWPDGTIRVGGREYNGLVLSACYTKGSGERTMTCLSCHAMHEGDPRGQIAPSKRGDAACTSCHGAKEGHAHHATGSPGAACVACHMPKTSYALLSAVRSHRVESPRADPTKPNACNLCHLDRSLGWTARAIAAWYGKPALPVPADRAEIPEGAIGALRGDAAVRVLVADALGSREAPVGAPFRAQLLGVLRQDPYAAIRFVADRSHASALMAAPSTRHAGAAPLPDDLVRTLLAERDGRPVTIAE